MKKHFLLALALMMGVGVMAQEEVTEEVTEEEVVAQEEEPAKTSNWSHEGNVGLNFGQSSFTNWAAGGQNSLNWQGILYYDLKYETEKFDWDNTLNASLGYCYFDFKKKPIKTDDMIELTSLAGLYASEKLNYSAELAFRSQFAKGYDYDNDPDTTHYISRFLAPAYISLGFGIEWEPNEYFSLNFAPITGRLTIVQDTALAKSFGFTPELDPNDNEHVYHKTRMEFGARAVAKFQYPIFKNVDFKSKLELFSNYLKNPQYVDVDWQNALVLKVNTWLNCNVGTHLIYDYDIPFANKTKGSKVQFKEVLSIGILFTL